MEIQKNTTGPIEKFSNSLISSFMAQVYTWMMMGLATTAMVAFALATYAKENLDFAENLYSLILPIGLVELGIVIWLSARADKMSAGLSSILFIVYAALNGVFFSSILLVYAIDVVALTFLATTLTFGAMALYGYTTKQDLTKFGNIAIMGVIGLIIGSIINIFAQSEGLYWLITYVGIGAFIVLTAYDTQKLKAFAAEAEMKNEPISKYAIQGALSLYLDFINLFILILRVLGGNRK